MTTTSSDVRTSQGSEATGLRASRTERHGAAVVKRRKAQVPPRSRKSSSDRRCSRWRPAGGLPPSRRCALPNCTRRRRDRDAARRNERRLPPFSQGDASAPDGLVRGFDVELVRASRQERGHERRARCASAGPSSPPTCATAASTWRSAGHRAARSGACSGASRGRSPRAASRARAAGAGPRARFPDAREPSAGRAHRRERGRPPRARRAQPLPGGAPRRGAENGEPPRLLAARRGRRRADRRREARRWEPRSREAARSRPLHARREGVLGPRPHAPISRASLDRLARAARGGRHARRPPRRVARRRRRRPPLRRRCPRSLAAIRERLELMPLVAEAKRAAGLPLEAPEQEARVLETPWLARGTAAARRAAPAASRAARARTLPRRRSRRARRCSSRRSPARRPPSRPSISTPSCVPRSRVSSERHHRRCWLELPPRSGRRRGLPPRRRPRRSRPAGLPPAIADAIAAAIADGVGPAARSASATAHPLAPRWHTIRSPRGQTLSSRRTDPELAEDRCAVLVEGGGRGALGGIGVRRELDRVAGHRGVPPDADQPCCARAPAGRRSTCATSWIGPHGMPAASSRASHSATGRARERALRARRASASTCRDARVVRRRSARRRRAPGARARRRASRRARRCRRDRRGGRRRRANASNGVIDGWRAPDRARHLAGRDVARDRVLEDRDLARRASRRRPSSPRPVRARWYERRARCRSR